MWLPYSRRPPKGQEYAAFGRASGRAPARARCKTPRVSRFTFDNTYARLPARFYARVRPTPVREPRLVQVNHTLARDLGVDPDWLASDEGVGILAGNSIPDGAEPLAMAYAGHQFGSFVPELGDGRAILLGETLSQRGARVDVQLKGSGRTPFSRRGDGRAALGPVLREYVVAEAMAALGVPTTRALAAVTTGELVVRETRLPGAVLTRVAASHLRVGTFQFFAARNDHEAVAELTRYALARHFPPAPAENQASELLDRVITAQAKLVASWLSVGFIHGVMNTDNTAISGETLDFGPCAFLDEFDPRKVFSSIDHGGRYAFANQPRIAHWNLTRLAEALLPQLGDDEPTAVRIAGDVLDRFPDRFRSEYDSLMRAKLGLRDEEAEDAALVEDLLHRLAADRVDYTLFFRALCAAAIDESRDQEVAALFADRQGFHDWAAGWRLRLRRSGCDPEDAARAMRLANPAIIPRNHRIEQAISAATELGDFEPFELLVRALEHPYDDQPQFADLTAPPLPNELVTRTFCGT